MEMILKKKQLLLPLILGVIFSIIYTSIPLKLFIGVVGAITIGMLCLYDIKIGVMTSILTLPFIPDMMSLLLIIFVFSIFVFNKFYKEEYRLKESFVDIPILLFVIVITVATFTSVNVSGSFRDLAIHLSSIGLVIVLVSSINSKKELNIILTLFIVVQTIVALYGISQYFTGLELDPAWVDEVNNPDVFIRVYSVFGNPNIFAEYLVMAIPLSLSLALVSKDVVKKVFFSLTTITLLTALVLTLSRGGWLGTAFGMFVFLLLIKKRLLLLTIPMGIVGLFIMPQSIANRILSIGNLLDSSNAYRIRMWKITTEIIRDNWIAGVGFGYEPFKQTFETYIRTMPVYHAHNTYLEIFAELGIGGILLFLALIFIVYKYAILKAIKSEDKYIKYVVSGLLACISALLIHGLAEHVLYLTRIIVTFWMLVGCLLAIIKLDNKQAENLNK